MGYLEKRHVKKEDLKIGETYYTCSYTGAIKVTLLEMLKYGNVLVEQKRKKGNKKLIRPRDYMFSNPEFAKQCGKRWEHYERKRRKSMKERKNNKNKK